MIGFGGIQPERVIYPGHRVAWKVDIHNGADTLNDGTLTHIQIPKN
jgi:hypothetical protein